MKSICFYFQVHQPFRLRKYRFFDIGKDHHYYDDFQNDYIMRRVGDKCYLPMNQLLLDLINEYGSRFKVSFSISGTALDQFEMYYPEVMESFKKLAATGSVEFLAETYPHALSSLKSKDEFTKQVQKQKARIKDLFGQEPTTFRNTELIYSNEIGAMVADMGFKTMLTEGAKHILGWKSPNYIYTNAINPKLKLLLKNFQLSDDIAFRFSSREWNEWPLTVDKYVGWLNQIGADEQVINLFMDYETFGEHQWPETGIFEFMKALPGEVFKHSNFEFNTPSEVSDKFQPIAKLNVPYPISWADEERDLTAWLGNELQDEAFDKLYALEKDVKKCGKPDILKDWEYLQTSDHFYYMCTKWFSDGDVHKYFNPYGSPYDAFINYMNILSDFEIRVNECVESSEKKLPEQVKKNKSVKNKKADKTKPKTKKVKSSTKQKPSQGLFERLTNLNDQELKNFLKTFDDDTILYSFYHSNKKLKSKVKKVVNKELSKKLDKFNPPDTKVSKKDIENARNRMRYHIKKTIL